MMNSLLSLDELFNFMCWMLMKIDSIMGIRKKETTPAVVWKNSSVLC